MALTRRLLIVWCSMTGGTRQLAQAARQGAARAGVEPGLPARAGLPADGIAHEPGAGGVEVLMLRADEAGPSDVLAASAYLFATPENLASMAGVMKDFFDRSYYAALDRISGRPYASIVCAGSDGRGAAGQIARICTGLRLRAVADPLLVCVGAQTPSEILYPKSIAPDERERAAQLGEAMAAGLALGIW